jgi:amino acid transporter
MLPAGSYVTPLGGLYVAIHYEHDHQYRRNFKSLNIIWCIVCFFCIYWDAWFFSLSRNTSSVLHSKLNAKRFEIVYVLSYYNTTQNMYHAHFFINRILDPITSDVISPYTFSKFTQIFTWAMAQTWTSFLHGFIISYRVDPWELRLYHPEALLYSLRRSRRLYRSASGWYNLNAHG